MIKQDYITIKELDEKLDEKEKNILIDYVSGAVCHMEKMDASCSDIINGSNIRINKSVTKHLTSSEQKKYDIEVTNYEISLFHNYIPLLDRWLFPEAEFSCIKADENELLAKGIILIFLLRALNKKGIGDIIQIGIRDALDEKNMTAFEKRIEELASRILIPQSVFTSELGNDILSLWKNENRELMTISWERHILLAKLKSYGVSEKMAKVRLKIAVFDGEYNAYEDQAHLNDFTHYYDESHQTKGSCKQMDNKQNGD